MSFIKKCKSTEKSKRCLLSFHYAEYVLGNERVLKEILDFLKDEDYRIRCSTISLLQDIISDSNRQRLIDAIQSLLSTEKSLAVKERIVKFFEYVNVETIFQCRGDSESE